MTTTRDGHDRRRSAAACPLVAMADDPLPRRPRRGRCLAGTIRPRRASPASRVAPPAVGAIGLADLRDRPMDRGPSPDARKSKNPPPSVLHATSKCGAHRRPVGRGDGLGHGRGHPDRTGVDRRLGGLPDSIDLPALPPVAAPSSSPTRAEGDLCGSAFRRRLCARTGAPTRSRRHRPRTRRAVADAVLLTPLLAFAL